MATVVESEAVRETSLDWVETLNDDDYDVDDADCPPLPPPPPPQSRLSADGRVPTPLPPPPPLPTADSSPREPLPPPVVRRSRNLKQRYRVSELDLKSTLGTGTFGRVILVRHRQTREYLALKALPIAEVIRLKQVEHVHNEKDILLMVRHPFVVNLLCTEHNDRYLYMVFEYVGGGELFSYLRNAGRFDPATAVFYAAEITLVFDYLHSLAVVYRDLKPENVLLDREGHIKICDFGFAKKLKDRTWTLCGTPEYLAPEVIQSRGYGKAIDWWSLGIFVYEMLVGYPPFFDEKPFVIYEKILAGKIDWPKHMDPVARDLIKKLLVQDRTKRLGNMKNGADDVKSHRWFRNVNWDDVYARKIEAPIIPLILHDGDTRNFDIYQEVDLQTLQPSPDEDIALFLDF